MGNVYKVTFSPEAEEAIYERAKYIAIHSGSRIIADRYISGLKKFCESLSIFPHRSEKRDDLHPELYVTNYRGTDIIAYEIDENTKSVHISDIVHSARDYERVLRYPD